MIGEQWRELHRKALKNKSFVAIVPARGGSKGIPGKNVTPLPREGGKPLMMHAIDEARKAGIFDRIIVSTDCPKIKAVADIYRVEVIDRPAALAQDDTPTEPVIAHALRQLNQKYDYVQLIEPTAPLVQDIDFLEAAKFLVEQNCDLVIGISESPYSAIFPLGVSNSIRNCYPKELRRKGRQYLTKQYFINGCIYVGKWDIFYDEKDFYEADVRGHIMPRYLFADINIYSDLEVAELELSRRKAMKDFFRSQPDKPLRSYRD